MTARPRAPIIVIGMHRSGTSVLARALQRLGVFMGWRRQHGDEAAFFAGVNEWLLRQSGGAWDNPEPIRRLVQHGDIRALVVEHIRIVMRSPRAISFLGTGKYLRYGTLERLDVPWGWKDPRNTFTLPIWLDCFPHARVIHIYRHGVDVASSLKARHEGMLAAAKARHRRLERLRWLRPKRGGFTDSLRCESLTEAFFLWEEYLAEARRQVGSLGDRATEVRFEDLMEHPRAALAGVARASGLDVSTDAIEAVAGQFVRGRAFAYRARAELVEFAGRMAGPLKAQGY